jgi:hypothetical protein
MDFVRVIVSYPRLTRLAGGAPAPGKRAKGDRRWAEGDRRYGSTCSDDFQPRSSSKTAPFDFYAGL